MCGIFVYIGTKYSAEDLKPHFDKIRHRGPDNSKIINICPNVVFGFHRLAIIDSAIFEHQSIYHPEDPQQIIVTNGIIYNYKTIRNTYQYPLSGKNDSDVMLHLYHDFGVETMVRELDGVYAFVIWDHDKIIAGTDIIGVRPLFVAYLTDGELLFASEEKALFGLNPVRIERFKPGTFVVHSVMEHVLSDKGLTYHPFFDWYHGVDRIDLAPLCFTDEKAIMSTVKKYLIQSVKKRMISDRPIGCLLSGGLDSSIITSIASRFYATKIILHSSKCHLSKTTSKRYMNKGMRGHISELTNYGRNKSRKNQKNNYFDRESFADTMCKCVCQQRLNNLQTFSVGMKCQAGISYSPDLEYAQKVADKLGTKHHRIEFSFDEAFKCIPEVIWALGSWDCTTVRASIPQFIMAKYIRNETNVKVLMSGEGAEEIFGSYSYLKKASNADEFSEEVIDLCRNSYQFDALRADRTLSYFGLEMREPFLDIKLFPYVLFRIPAQLKMHGGIYNRMEKYILRKAFEEGDYLPDDVLWRKKEAFSDGVNYSFREQLIAKINTLVSDSEFNEKIQHLSSPKPLTKEAYYYRKIYDDLFPNPPSLVTKNWMPRLDWFPEHEQIRLVDPSARVLSTYDIDKKEKLKN